MEELQKKIAANTIRLKAIVLNLASLEVYSFITDETKKEWEESFNQLNLELQYAVVELADVYRSLMPRDGEVKDAPVPD